MRGLLALLLLVGCEASLECEPGTMSYDGRPPRRMFAFVRGCADNCFSMPTEGVCTNDCPTINVRPGGALFADRHLVLADLESLGAGSALVFSFRFVDEAGGSAPEGWSFLSAGAGTYMADQVEGTARFLMDVQAVAVEVAADGLLVPTEELSEVVEADPGRLEILSASAERMSGRFFLSYDTETGQPQGEVIGCFNLGVGEVLGPEGMQYRVLTP